jgi:hypothetical protein
LAWASVRAYAAYHFFAAQSITERMYESANFSPDQIDLADDYLKTALAWFPGNPDYREFSGRIKEIRAGQPGVLGAERQAMLESAAADYRSTLAERPLWPYGWANLLAVKDKLGQVDGEFHAAMARAAETGPWEPRVQLQLVRSGIRNWDELGRDQRRQVQKTIDAALQVQPREVFEVARFYARPELICPGGEAYDQIRRWCSAVL